MRHFATLDVLRGVAAIAVMIWHSNGHPIAPDGGYLAVDMFFGLSGFVIALKYEHRLRNGMPAARFIILRIARLWPMILVGSLPVLFIAGRWWETLLLIPEFGESEALFPANSPFWSLLMEMAAYFLFSLFGPKLTNSHIVCILIAAAFALFFLVYIDYAMISEFGAFQNTIAGGLARVTFSFFFGMLIFRIRQARGMPVTASRLAWLIPLALLAMMYAVPIPGNYTGFIAIVLVLPWILWLATKWEVPDIGVAKKLAAISYPLYCIHMPVLSMAGAYGVPLVYVWPVLISVSYLLDRCIDQPCRDWVRQLTKMRRPPSSKNQVSFSLDDPSSSEQSLKLLRAREKLY